MITRLLRLLLSVLTLCVTLEPTWATESTGVGNGGGGWVCRELDGRVRSARLVDFFEAEAEHHLTLRATATDGGALIAEARGRIAGINPTFAEIFDRKLAYVRAHLVDVRNVRLREVDDSLYRIIPSPSTCLDGTLGYEQVVNFSENGEVLINRDLFDLLTEQEKAGLFAHEAIYAVLREVESDRNSLRTRRLVGLLFSTLEPNLYAREFMLTRPHASARIAQLSAGSWHTCAVTTGGQVLCWGTNQNGQLGNRTVAASPIPVAVPGIRGARSVSAGGRLVCATLHDARVMCWGTLPTLGSITGRIQPPTEAPSFNGAVSLAVSYSTACAVMPTGRVYCNGRWGRGMDAVMPMPSIHDALRVFADSNDDQYCALRQGGKVSCWGAAENSFGGSCANEAANFLRTPCEIPGWEGVESLSLSSRSTCAVLNRGQVECLGWVPSASLEKSCGKRAHARIPIYERIFPRDDCESPAKIRLPGSIHSLEGGSLNGHCGLQEDSTPLCWGDWIPNVTNDWTLAQGPFYRPPGNSIYSSLTLGENHACAITRDAGVQCVGRGTMGELGQGEMRSSFEWVNVKFENQEP